MKQKNQVNEEQVLRSMINNMVRESIASFGGPMEASQAAPAKKNQGDERKKNMRRYVISVLKKDGTNNAPYAEKLWPDKEDANARSQFAKCKNGEKNDNGSVYSFTDSEISQLYSMLNNRI